MTRVNEMTMDELGEFIEQKLLEILGDPDSGLQLKPEFQNKLEMRLAKSGKRIPHQRIIKSFVC